MGAPTDMPITTMNTDLLTLAQWFSPAYPVGSFAYSHGLEAAVAGGDVTVDTLQDWLEDVLQYGAGHADALFLAAAYHAPDAGAVDATARAFAPSRERLSEADLQGDAFCKTTSAAWDMDLEGLVFPVAAGRAAKLSNLPLDQTATLYLQGFASNLVAAAQRLMPLGQTRAQMILRSLAPLIAEIVRETADGDLDALSGTAFLADIASMRHETQEPRIFRT